MNGLIKLAQTADVFVGKWVHDTTEDLRRVC